MAGTGGAVPSAMTALPGPGGVAVTGVPSCAEMVRSFDWSGTPLGPIESWDPVVRATVEVVLASPVPMALAYGDDYILIYNDAYADVLGVRHPEGLGRPAAEVFGRLWKAPGVGAVIDDVYRTGQPYL